MRRSRRPSLPGMDPNPATGPSGYTQASAEQIAALRASGAPISDTAIAVYVPADPQRVQRLRAELLTSYAPATEAAVMRRPQRPGVPVGPEHL